MEFKQSASKRASVRQNVKQYRQRQEFKPFLNENGEIDIVAYFNSPHIKLKIAGMVDDALSGGRVNSQFLKWLSQVIGFYTERGKESGKVELTHSDIAREAEQIIEYFRQRLEETPGICPVCGVTGVLSTEVCDN